MRLDAKPTAGTVEEGGAPSCMRVQQACLVNDAAARLELALFPSERHVLVAKGTAHAINNVVDAGRTSDALRGRSF